MVVPAEVAGNGLPKQGNQTKLLGGFRGSGQVAQLIRGIPRVQACWSAIRVGPAGNPCGPRPKKAGVSFGRKIPQGDTRGLAVPNTELLPVLANVHIIVDKAATYTILVKRFVQ